MRSCMYCGRELKDGEKCDCAGARARRAASGTGQNENNSTAKNQNSAKTDNSGGYYRTGYTKNDGRFKRSMHRFKTKREERRNRPKKQDMKGAMSYIWDFLKAPADMISNPKSFSLPQMILIAACQGAVIGMGIFFIVTGVNRSWFSMLAKLIGFSGIEGYRSIMYVLSAAVSGAIGATVMFFIYSGIFFLIGKLIFRSYTKFTEFAQRLVLTNLPFTIFTAFGILCAFVSSTTFMILLLCGIMTSFILTYISLCREWSASSESKVIYAMVLGYFILFTIICSLIRISLIGG